MDTHGNELTKDELMAISMYHTLVTACERGFRGDTFATVDEYRTPGYDAAYRRGQIARKNGRSAPPVF